MAASTMAGGTMNESHSRQTPNLTLETLPQTNSNSHEIDTSDDNENGVDDGDVGLEDTDGDSLVGVSISKIQNDMKSPATPAITKTQALEASKSYFDAKLDEESIIFEEPEQTSSRESDSAPTRSNAIEHKQEAYQPSSSSSSSQPAVKDKSSGRSSLVSSILGNVGNVARPRSSSGSSIVENIKKHLPSMPSISLPKLYGNVEHTRKTLGPAGPGYVVEPLAQRQRAQTTVRTPLASRPPFDGALSSSEMPRPSETVIDDQTEPQEDFATPRVIRRVTSDNSLYLRRQPTGASEFDNYSKFANVSEMVNSRFKAITDSFQDSSLRLPKLPNLGISGSQEQGKISPNSETANNTILNRGPIQKPNRNPPAVDPSTSKHPLLKTALSRMSGDLVVMGGYRGSILREAQSPNRQLWVPIKVGMNLRKADLEVGLTREDELSMEERIIPDGTLSHVGPVDICRRLLRKIRRSASVREGILRLHDYGYDWRLSPDLLSDRLIKHLEKLPCNSKELPPERRGAWVVAHSLGGLITRYAVNRRPELFAGVVYAGTPQNCVNILGPIRAGDDVLFSSRVLTAQVNFTLRTSYALLPMEGRCFINKETGERYDIDFFDVKSWEDYRLSPCIKAPYHREKMDKRNSIFGSLSESKSQSNKRGSWFGALTGSDSKQPDEAATAQNQIKRGVEEVKEGVESAAESAKPDRPLSPTLLDGSSQASRSRPSIATQCTIPLPAATEYLTRTLSSVLEFKQNLSHKSDLQTRNAYPPAGIMFARNTPTVYGAFVASRDDIKYDDAFDDLAFAAGDGVVLASAAQLPAGYRCVKGGRVESDRGHVGLLGDLEGVGKCLNALIDARQRGVGMGAYAKDCK